MKALLALLVLLGVAGAATAQDLTYWTDIRPIFRKHCTACHANKYLKEPEVSGGLALDNYVNTMRGSRRAVVAAGKAKDSVLLEYLTTTDKTKRMPLDAEPLPKQTIDLIQQWIVQGAKEGTRPAELDAPGVGKSAPTRKLDVLIATTTTPPAGSVGKAPAGPLQLALQVGPLAPITAVAFSPEGKTLALGSYGQVVIWDMEKATPIKRLTNILGAVNDVRFSPKGEWLAIGGGQPSAKGDIRLVSTRDWKLAATLRGHDDVVFSLAFSPDGQTLASASFDHTLRLWNVAKHDQLRVFTHHSDFVHAVAWSRDGKFLATASKDRTAQWLNLETGKSKYTLSAGEQDVLAVAISPDGKRVVSSGYEPALLWWSTENGEKIRTQGGHGIAVHELVFTPDGKKLVSCAADRTVRTWDGTSGAPVKTYNAPAIPHCVAVNPAGTRLAAGCFDGGTRIWDEATGKLLVTLYIPHGDAELGNWLAITPEGYTLASDDLVSLARWRIQGQNVAATPVWSALRQPDRLAQALRAEALPAAVFAKEKDKGK
jgi:WD40 repeat protein